MDGDVCTKFERSSYYYHWKGSIGLKFCRMAQSDNILTRIQDWKTNFEKQGEAKLAEIRQLIDVNNVLETYFREIDRLPEKLRKSSLYEFIATCEDTDAIVNEPIGEPSISLEMENKFSMGQKSNAWTNRLRAPRKLLSESCTRSNMKTPACTNSKPIILRTPAGNVRLPHAITPKVQDGDDVKFRTLRREEVAFSVAGTPVIAGNEIEGDENVFLVNELLHAKDEELTPQTRNVVQGMKRLIGRIRTSEVPEHF
uniref:Uncharacterized protein n=1 Tax=Setaria digitata TaxID=48799 RepID=A0A915Q2W4_9BILA